MFRAFRRWLEPAFLEDVGDGGAGDPVPDLAARPQSARNLNAGSRWPFGR